MSESTLQFRCTCGRKLSAPVTAAGRRGRCPACKEIFTVPTPPEPEVEPLVDLEDAVEEGASQSFGTRRDEDDDEIPLAPAAMAAAAPARGTRYQGPMTITPA